MCDPDVIFLIFPWRLVFNLIYMMADDWSLGYTSVSGSEDICVGGQRLTVVFSPVFPISQLLLFVTVVMT